ncbi:MAG: LysM peptidoglycan-binding domain-containing protein [Desulfobacteraceae bacterium]|jgi:LysM repeat protein
MDEDFGKEMDELKKDRSESLKRNRKKKNIRRSPSQVNLNPEARYLVYSAIGVFALVVVLVLFSGGKREVSVGDYDTIKAKLGDLEKSVTKLEGTDRKIAHLESQVKRLERSLSKLTRPVTSRTKKRTYYEVRQGDTLSRIAQKYGITVEKLCRLNKITPKTLLRPGQRLLISSGG